MKIIERIFDDVLVIENPHRTDCRGNVSILGADGLTALNSFVIKEQRIYTMPKAHTFFGIHFQNEPFPQAKLITVIQGAGLDYAVDLRKGSNTFAQWRCVRLSAENALSVYIPAGFGHAFLSTSDDVIMLYQTDFHGGNGYTGRLNYKEPAIGLKLPIPITEIADYDVEAPFLNEI